MAKTSGAYHLSNSPCHLLHRAQQFAADQFAEAVGSDPITQRQFAVLSGVAANEGLTQTDLVKATGIDRSTLAELVARMTKRKLLKRTRAKDDARANTVSLTPAGRAMINKATPKVKAADAAILKSLGKTQRDAFVATLKKIDATLESSDDAAPAAKKAPARKTATRSAATKKKAPAKKPAAKKPARKAPARRAAAKTTSTRRTTTAKRAPARKPTTRRKR